MDENTSLLFGLDEFVVIDVTRVGDQFVQVVIEMIAAEAACPGCGVFSHRIKDRPRVRIRDLPASGQAVALWWRKRRLVCAEPACVRATFTQASTAIGPRARLTARLRLKVAQAIAVSNRAVAEVGREYALSWHTAHRALITAASGWLPAPVPTRVLGIDETRARSVRWVLEEAGWRRSNPWMTSFVDADPAGAGAVLGLVPGRSGTCVKDWLTEQDPAFRAGITLVVIDPSAPYASGIRAALPHARIAVDKWHLVRLGNEMLTEVRQRVTREQLGRRGTAGDRIWTHRRMFLTGGEKLSARQLALLREVLATEDPTNELGAAWGVKERLRMLLAESDPARIRAARWAFLRDAVDADLPEATRLAATVETWWPTIETALVEGITNARTEGFNRIIKQTKRVGCGFTNMENYQRRIMSHIALTRVRQIAA